MKVSVVIPTYNRASLVQETIESVLRQSFRDFEIIVIDDGSTDDTEQGLRRFSSEIHYVKQENRGLNAARNVGIDLAKGEYIAVLDNDDLWRPFKLELEVSILDGLPEVGFVFGDFYIMKPDGRNIPNGIHTWFPNPPVWDDIFNFSLDHDFGEMLGSHHVNGTSVRAFVGDIYGTSLFGPRVLPSASLFRRSKADGWLKFNEHDSLCGDWEFFALLSRRHGAAFIDMELAFNRSHEDAVRLTRTDPRLQRAKRLEMTERIWKNDNSFYSENRTDVDGVMAELWSELLALNLKAGNLPEAKNAARELESFDTNLLDGKIALYKALAHTPGSRYIIPILLSLRKFVYQR